MNVTMGERVIWMYKQGFTFENMLDLDIPYHKLLEGLYCAYVNTKDEFFKEEYWRHCAAKTLEEKSYLILGDDHRGSNIENTYYSKVAFSYAKKLGIQVVLHGGDISDGMMDPSPKYATVEKQIDYIVNSYPKIDGVSHYITLGNHDKKYRSMGVNLANILRKKREDIQVLGFDIGYVRIFFHLVSIEHGGNTLKRRPDWYLLPKLRLVSHSHGMDIGRPLTYVPALCKNDVQYFKNVGKKYYPGFLILNVENEKNYDLFCVSGYQFVDEKLKKTDEKSFYLSKSLIKTKK